MNSTRPILPTLALVLFFLGLSEAQQLRLVEGELSYGGKPLANRAILLEGREVVTWFDFLRFWETSSKIATIAVTDKRGFFQVVDLPAGEYTLKLVRAGEEPLLLKNFKLERGYSKLNLKKSCTN